jgi:hypothetical protein
MKRLPHYIFITSLVSVFWLVPNLVLAQGITDAISGAIQTVLFTLVMAVFGSFVFLASLLLDFGINTFVIGFGDMFLNSGVGVAVNNTWVIIRDFVNLFFIFGFVYIGFKMILNANDSNTRRWLVNIILAALLVNFSLFATKFVIDISNQLAAQIAVNGLGLGSTIDPNTGLVKVAVGTEFMDRMGLRSLLSVEEPNGWGYIFGSVFLFLTAMFVFAAGGILLIIRFAMLNLFMVLSPLMFIGWVLPPLGDTMRRFWGMFIGRAFFAPIYLLFIYFSLQILSGLQQSVGNFSNPNWQIFEKVNQDASVLSGNLGTFPFFILVCIFMAISLVAANKLGADGGAKAVSLGKSFGNRVRKVAVNNSVGFAARGVNRVSERTQTAYQRADARIANMSGWRGSFARGARNTLNVATLGATSDKVLQSTFKAGKELSIDGSETAEMVDKQATERRGRQSQALAEMEREQNFENYTNQIESTATSAQELQDAFNGLGRTIRQMGNDERAELGYETLSSARVAMHLNDSHIEALEKSGRYSYQEIQNIKNARNQAFVSIANGGTHPRANPQHPRYDAGMERFNVLPAGRTLQNPLEMRNFQQAQRQAAINRSVKDVGNMEVDVFTDQAMAEHLTPQALEERMRNGGISNVQLETIRGNIETWVNNGIAVGARDAERRRNMWTQWVNRSIYGAQVGFNFNPVPQNNLPSGGQNINNQSNQVSQASSNPSIITPASPGWSAANQNLPPRPGPQP